MNIRLSWFSWRQAQGISKLCMALLLAWSILLAFPGSSFAHAVLVRSDPAQGAVLRVPPGQVRLWFSEVVEPQFSTAQVVTPSNQQAGSQQVSVSGVSGSTSEIVVTLSSRLLPGSYVVLWRTVSTVDGHVESGSFSFTLARPDGTLPPPINSSVITGTTNAVAPTLPLSLPTLISLLMTFLVELGAIYWVGAAFWQLFVVEVVMEKHATQHDLLQQVRERQLERILPLVIGGALLAHVGVLIGQGLALASGNSATSLTPALLEQLVRSGRFGLWWLVRVLLLTLALLLLLTGRLVGRRSRISNRLLAWVSLGLGLLLFIALALSSHAAALASDKVMVAVLGDWFHLVAAAIWVGGMLTIVLGYVPVLSRHALVERASSLVTTLRYYSPWALAGVLLMAITGPLSATFQLNSWAQLLTTAYGNVLLIKVFLVMGLLVLSAYHTLFLRARIRIALRKHSVALTRLEHTPPQAVPDSVRMRWMEQVKQREVRLALPTRRLLFVLRLEALLGVAVLLCVGLMNVLGGTLVPTTSTVSTGSVSRATAPLSQTLNTFDRRFQVILTMTPRHVGTNSVKVRVIDPRTGAAVSRVKVQLNTELLERDMGVNLILLTANGAGQFSGAVELPVSGTWRIIVQIITPDDPNRFHEAYTDIGLVS